MCTDKSPCVYRRHKYKRRTVARVHNRHADALIAFTVADYITGVMCAVVTKTLSSEVGARGIFKKVVIFLLVGIGHLADVYLLGDGEALRTALIFFYISNEGISLIENAAIIGLPIPEKLKDILTQIRDKNNKGDKK
ncbi:hypothetical protein FACS18949_12130 [Clostridia bacterium]|nr:hypothetical protein FACS18949_12130 [Clostridia bacterium]